MVKRYWPENGYDSTMRECASMKESPHGAWVDYADYHDLTERCERLEALVRAIVRGRGHCFIPTDDPSRPTFNWDERADAALSGSSGGEGMSAFPVLSLLQDRYGDYRLDQEGGLTKRELFAAMAMQGLLASSIDPAEARRNGWDFTGWVSRHAVLQADALLVELEKTP